MIRADGSLDLPSPDRALDAPGEGARPVLLARPPTRARTRPDPAAAGAG
ncbi:MULTISPECIES: hypothetical protein [unclassified Methylobacterium]|nr:MULTISPECIES: hypothetical protein [Methylobacterium]WFT79188.1 hypothetical protein QA634_28830 [Methylobacterium nodulans]